jgi:hypothetical protein
MMGAMTKCVSSVARPSINCEFVGSTVDAAPYKFHLIVKRSGRLLESTLRRHQFAKLLYILLHNNVDYVNFTSGTPW